ncbi:hypothetical protein ACFWJN_28195, partial [Streptomyces albidochromogenes]
MAVPTASAPDKRLSEVTPSERRSETATPTPCPVPDRTTGEVAAPRGGVAAGERPAGQSGDDTTVVAGSVAGAVILAGAGTVML